MDKELNRVSSQIATAIMEFYQQRMAGDPSFTSDQLRFYVMNHITGRIAPASADRILRQMRQKGQLDYYVANRAKSQYKMIPVRPFSFHRTVKELSETT